MFHCGILLDDRNGVIPAPDELTVPRDNQPQERNFAPPCGIQVTNWI